MIPLDRHWEKLSESAERMTNTHMRCATAWLDLRIHDTDPGSATHYDVHVTAFFKRFPKGIFSLFDDRRVMHFAVHT